MRIEMPRYMERFGALKIYDVQKVLELTGGLSSDPKEGLLGIVNVGRNEIERIESEMSIIVPVKNENPKVLEGVLSGIPHEALVIIVSNSDRKMIDHYRVEMDTVFQFYKLTGRPFIMVHQRDPAWRDALIEAGYPYLLDDNGLVRNGKGEGMILGLLLAKATGRKYVGFVDSDNYIPGAVNEYVDIYATGFYMSKSPYTMIRIRWPYKTKFVGKRFYFRRRGRVSEITNRFINMLLTRLIDFESDIIKTSNAGEHAMTMALAERIGYSSGFSIEPYELVFMLEEYTGLKKPRFSDVMKHTIEIYQIEPRNPHVHEERGDKHIAEMLKASLSTIYHSKLADEELKNRIYEELITRKAIKAGEKLEEPRKFPPIYGVDSKRILKILKDLSETFVIVK